MFSTYPSRMRTGVTGLMQPEHITGGPREREAFLAEMERELAAGASGSGPGAQAGGRGSASGASTPRLDSLAPGRRGAAATFAGRGRGRVVNYVEADESEEEESESEMSELEEPPSDPEDESYGERRRRDRDGNPLPSTLPSRGGRREPERHGSTSAYGYGQAGGSATDVQAAMRAGRWRKKREELERGWTWLGDKAPGERVTSVPKRETRHQYVYVLVPGFQRGKVLIAMTGAKSCSKEKHKSPRRSSPLASTSRCRLQTQMDRRFASKTASYGT